MTLTTPLLTDITSTVQARLAALFLYAAVSEDDTPVTLSDTDLFMEVFRDAVDETDVSVTGETTVTLRVSANEANNNTIQKAGIFSAPTYAVDNCDATTGWTDSTDMTVSLNTTTYYEGSGSLNLTKDGTSSTTASTSKGTTSRDFTNQTLSVVVYILDSTTLNKLASTAGLKIRYGSDSSNYYEWSYDRASLAVGKNYLNDLTSSNADTTTGTPSLTACDYFAIVITTTGSSDTWSAGSIIMDDIKLIGGTLYLAEVLNDILKTDSIELYIDFTVENEVTEV